MKKVIGWGDLLRCVNKNLTFKRNEGSGLLLPHVKCDGCDAQEKCIAIMRAMRKYEIVTQLERLKEKTWHVTFEGRRKGSIGLNYIGWTETVKAEDAEKAQAAVLQDFDVAKMHSVHEYIEPDNRFDPYWEAMRKGE